MRITFIGNPHNEDDNRGHVEVGGIRFPLNAAVDVEPEPHFERLRRNNHFLVEDGVAPPSDPELEALIAQAEALGIKLDKRKKWDAEKITAAIAEASSKDPAQ